MNTKKYLGKEVDVVMDRPFGSKHPKWGFVYPVNYGYIPNTISGDGEELDAYVLGEFKPLETFHGVVRAIIHRINDNDDKLVVTSLDKNYNREQIFALTEFQDSYFESEIILQDGRTLPFVHNGKLTDLK
jgi:inorganic pyrophosphatase